MANQILSLMYVLVICVRLDIENNANVKEVVSKAPLKTGTSEGDICNINTYRERLNSGPVILDIELRK